MESLKIISKNRNPPKSRTRKNQLFSLQRAPLPNRTNIQTHTRNTAMQNIKHNDKVTDTFIDNFRDTFHCKFIDTFTLHLKTIL